ncbi:MAG: hypothetical protein R3F11_19830 [Verrucomicrobiales bacterium]
MITKKKKTYKVSPDLDGYLGRYGRHSDIPRIYSDLLHFSEAFPHSDPQGRETQWLTVVYQPLERAELNKQLTRIYAELKIGDLSLAEHLKVERIDFCQFGNSRPFRIRITNQYNDNSDHFYVKRADASRIYGLELEHILSPNRINFLVSGGTLIEEHIAGIPGDAFIREYMGRPDLNQVRIAKEFVKFNERCFIRLLGDMRAANYVIDITPDFEEVQYRVRPIDFDQQSYEGRHKVYLTQFFTSNYPVVELVIGRLNATVIKQYQREERTLIARRSRASRERLAALLECMENQELAPAEHVRQLAAELGDYHKSDAFKNCERMGALVRANIRAVLEKI